MTAASGGKSIVVNSTSGTFAGKKKSTANVIIIIIFYFFYQMFFQFEFIHQIKQNEKKKKNHGTNVIWREMLQNDIMNCTNDH